jgi:hypothetical protein
MQRRHYEAIATALARSLSYSDLTAEQVEVIVRKMARELTHTNPRFDTERFVSAVIDRVCV